MVWGEFGGKNVKVRVTLTVKTAKELGMVFGIVRD